MTKIFIGGSIGIRRLGAEAVQTLDNIMSRGFTVLVGDADGADKAVQNYLAEKRYENVVVFCAGNTCRNNLGNWAAKYIVVDGKARDYRFYMAKDLEMAKDADYGFMIWDGKSSGTLSNILELLERGKKVRVYMAPEKKIITLCKIEDLHNIIKTCPIEAVKTFETKFNLSHRLQAPSPAQMQLFPL